MTREPFVLKPVSAIFLKPFSCLLPSTTSRQEIQPLHCCFLMSSPRCLPCCSARWTHLAFLLLHIRLLTLVPASTYFSISHFSSPSLLFSWSHTCKRDCVTASIAKAPRDAINPTKSSMLVADPCAIPLVTGRVLLISFESSSRNRKRG